MKRILFIMNALEIGGAQKVFIRTAKSFAKDGYSVKILLLFKKNYTIEFLEKMNIEDLDLDFLDIKNIYDIYGYLKLYKYLKKENYEIIFSTLNESIFISRIVKIFLPKTKLIIREANISNTKTLKYKISDFIFNFFVSKIICVSNDVYMSVFEYQRIHRSKGVVIMNGVEVSEKTKVYPENKSHLIKLLNIGRLVEQKNQWMLIYAIKKIVENGYLNFHLDIYGEGALEIDFKKYIEKNNLEKFITIKNFVESKKLDEIYLSTDIFILSSNFEGSPNALIRAMSLGLCCISTDVSGANELITNNYNGFLIEINKIDELERLLINLMQNLSKLKENGKNAKEEILANYSFEKYMEKIKNLI